MVVAMGDMVSDDSLQFDVDTSEDTEDASETGFFEICNLGKVSISWTINLYMEYHVYCSKQQFKHHIYRQHSKC